MRTFNLRFFQAYAWSFVAALAATCILTQAAFAGSITYPGPFSDIPGGGSSIYTDVIESDAVNVPPARFGEPEANVDQLDFDPINFQAVALDGAIDFIDVQLNFDLETVPSMGITSLIIEEVLDYNFLLGGTADTRVAASIGGIIVKILEVNHAPIVPITVLPAGAFAERNAADDPANGTIVNSVLVELLPHLPANSVATKLEVVLDDTLAARSEDGTSALIKKKDFVIKPGVEPDPNFIAEPGTLGLITLAGMLGGMIAVRKRLG